MRKFFTAAAGIALVIAPASAAVGPGFNSNGNAADAVWWEFEWCQVESHFGYRYRPCWRL